MAQSLAIIGTASCSYIPPVPLHVHNKYITYSLPPPLIQLGEGEPWEGVSPEIHVHKITNVTVFYMALGLNDFDAGKSITRAIERGGP